MEVDVTKTVDFSADDISASFIPKALAEHWLLTADPEEIIVLLREITLFYNNLSDAQKQSIDQGKLRNVVMLLVKHLRFTNYSLKVQILNFLTVLGSDHESLFRYNVDTMFNALQDLLQDMHDEAREAALRVAIVVVSRADVLAYERGLVNLMECTYQYHESALQVLLVSMNSALHNHLCGGLAGDRPATDNVVGLLVNCVNYAATILTYTRRVTDESNEEEGEYGWQDNTVGVHEICVDVIALGCVAIHTIDTNATSLADYNPSMVFDRLLHILEHFPMAQDDSQAIKQRLETLTMPTLSSLVEAFPAIVKDVFHIDYAALPRPKPEAKTNSVATTDSTTSSAASIGVEGETIKDSSDTAATARQPMKTTSKEDATNTKGGNGGVRKQSTDRSKAQPTPVKQAARAVVREAVGGIGSNVRESTSPTPSITTANSNTVPTNGNVTPRAPARQSSKDYSDKEREREPWPVKTMVREEALPMVTGNAVISQQQVKVVSARKEEVTLPQLSPPSKETQHPPHPQPQPLSILVSQDTLAVTVRASHTSDGLRLHDENSEEVTDTARLNHQSDEVLGHSVGTPYVEVSYAEDGERLQELRHTNYNYQRAATSRLRRTRLRQQQQPLTVATDSPTAAAENSYSTQPLSPLSRLKGNVAFPSLDVNEDYSSNDTAQQQALEMPALSSGNSLDEDTQHTPRQSTYPTKTKRKTTVSKPSPSHSDHNATPSSALPSPTRPENFEYIHSANLTPLVSPHSDFAKALRGLETQDWPELFGTITTMRRALVHHPAQVLQSGDTHLLVTLLIRQADNLRSALAKNALLAFADLFTALGRAVDVEVGAALPPILKRAADSSSFLGESADQALQAISDSVSPSRVLAALAQFADNKSAGLRATVSSCILRLVRGRWAEIVANRDVDGVLSLLCRLSQDQSQEARAAAKEALRELVDGGEVQRAQLETFLRPEALARVFKETSINARASPLRTPNRMTSVSFSAKTPSTADNPSLLAQSLDSPHATSSPSLPRIGDLRTPNRKPTVISSNGSGNGNAMGIGSDEMASPAMMENRKKTVSVSHSAAKRLMDSDSNLSQWQSVHATAVSGKSWQDRLSGVKRMTAMIVAHEPVLREVGRLDASLDAVLDALQEGSPKLVAAALDCAEEISSHCPSLLCQSVFQVAGPRLLCAVASSNRTVSHRATALLRRCLSEAPALQVAQFLCSIAEHGQDKTKGAALRVLCDVTRDLCADLNALLSIVRRLVFPAALRILSDSSRTDLRQGAAEIVKTIQLACREEPVWKWADSPLLQEEVRRITASL